MECLPGCFLHRQQSIMLRKLPSLYCVMKCTQCSEPRLKKGEKNGIVWLWKTRLLQTSVWEHRYECRRRFYVATNTNKLIRRATTKKSLICCPIQAIIAVIRIQSHPVSTPPLTPHPASPMQLSNLSFGICCRRVFCRKFRL